MTASAGFFSSFDLAPASDFRLIFPYPSPCHWPASWPLGAAGMRNFLLEAMKLRRLKLKKIEEPALFQRDAVIQQERPSGGASVRAFATRAFALQVKNCSEISVRWRRGCSCEEDGALLHLILSQPTIFTLGSGGLGRYHSRLGRAGRSVRTRGIGAPLPKVFGRNGRWSCDCGDGER